MPETSQDALTLRVAGPDDLPRVVRLAALDSARPPRSPVLLAEVDGALRLAVSLLDLKVVADPFQRTDEIRTVALARAAQARVANSGQRTDRQLVGAAPSRLRLRLGLG